MAGVDAAGSIYEEQADPADGLFGPASPFAADSPPPDPAPAAEPAGQSIRLATYSDRPELPELGAAAADALRAAGFAVEVVVQEYSTIEPALLDGSYDVVLATATLAAAATLVAILVGAAVVAPGLWRASRTGSALGRGSGVAAALLGALPEIVVALVLIAVVAVGWRLLPTSGFVGPQHLVLPALALGLPSGGLLGRILISGVDSTLAESWVRSWRSVGAGRLVVAAAVTRRAFAVALPQVALLLVGLLGSAVVVERAFAIPGLGSTALQGVLAQDIPVVQACVALLVLLGLGVGTLGVLAHRMLLGPGLRGADLPSAVPEPVPDTRLTRCAPWLAGGVLGVLIVLGLLRDPSAVVLADRLAAPSAGSPFGPTRWAGTCSPGLGTARCSPSAPPWW